MQSRSSASFTRSFSGIGNSLFSECMVSDHHYPETSASDPGRNRFMALWDTGSTGCMVSQRVVDACRLRERGRAPISNVSGTVDDVPRYVIDLYLPDGLVVNEVMVALGEFINFDVLIGMNVITLGDLAVTNANGQTVFTFRVPSQSGIDFTLS